MFNFCDDCCDLDCSSPLIGPEPCPSLLLQRHMAALLSSDKDMGASFLNSVLNQLNWAFSEFIGMIQEVGDAERQAPNHKTSGTLVFTSQYFFLPSTLLFSSSSLFLSPSSHPFLSFLLLLPHPFFILSLFFFFSLSPLSFCPSSPPLLVLFLLFLLHLHFSIDPAGG